MTTTGPATGADRTAGRALVAVGFDGSDSAHAAVRWAALEAAARGADLQVVTAWDPTPVNPWSVPYLAEWRARARHDAEAAAADARRIAGPHIHAEAEVVEGSPGRVMVERTGSADLVVVGSAGHVGLAGLLSGSVSRRLLHRARGPVVIVGPETVSDAVNRVVLSSTLDQDGETFGWLGAWLRARPVPVHVLASYALGHGRPGLHGPDLVDRVRASVQEQNDVWVTRLRQALPAGATVTTDVREGHAHEVLGRETRPGDLLVVPSGCEHSVPIAHGRCAIAIVPNPALAIAPSAANGTGA